MRGRDVLDGLNRRIPDTDGHGLGVREPVDLTDSELADTASTRLEALESVERLVLVVVEADDLPRRLQQPDAAYSSGVPQDEEVGG
jgi:hypothetical protein